MIDTNQPAQEIYKDALRWDAKMNCVPSWEEILEIEYIRCRGEVNMFTDNITRYAFDRGLLNAVNWLSTCRSFKISPSSMYDSAVKMHEKNHGPLNGWITESVKTDFEELELSLKEIELRKQLKQLKLRKRKNKK